jgi:hypothetical protein
MILDRKGTIHNNEVFKAVINGYKINLIDVREPNSDDDNDDDDKNDLLGGPPDQ